jgi:tetratricopeptide (TPR) repeat protein
LIALFRHLRYYHWQGHVVFLVLFWILSVAALCVGLLLPLLALGHRLPAIVPHALAAFPGWFQHYEFWLIFSWVVLAIACVALGGLSMRSLHYRYIALAGSRIGGPILRWLSTEWRPVPVLIVLSLLAAPFLPDRWFQPAQSNETRVAVQQQSRPGRNGEQGHGAVRPTSGARDLPNATEAAASAATGVTPGAAAPSRSVSGSAQAGAAPGSVPMSARLGYVLGFDLLLLFVHLLLDLRGRIVIEPFDDHTGEKPDPRTKAISVLLSDHLIRTRDLYHVVDQRTAVLARGVDVAVRDANIRTETVNELIKDTVSAESKVRFGFLEFSIRPLLQLLVLLAQGRRITGTLYKDGDLYVLNAQLMGGRHPFSWRIESSTSSSPLFDADSDGAQQGLEQMIEELACRIFTDVALESAVRWKATYHFNSGLRQYRDCLRTQKDRKLKLKRAEKAFMRALADDEKFDWAYYNLGLVYIGLGLVDAASTAFTRAIAQNRDRWEPYYALAQVYFEANEEKNHLFVVGLCERVVFLKPYTAKGFRMLCEAYYQEAVRKSKTKTDVASKVDADLARDLDRARVYGETAVANAWLQMCIENWRARTSNPEESRLPERLRLTRDCLSSLAAVYMALAEQPECVDNRSNNYRRAKDLFAQAVYLCDSDVDAHVGMGRVCERQGDYDTAAHHYRIALRIDASRADIWARLWLTSEALRQHEETDKSNRNNETWLQQFARAWNTWNNDQLGLVRNSAMHQFAWREFYDRSCDADSRGMVDIDHDYYILKPCGVHNAEGCTEDRDGDPAQDGGTPVEDPDAVEDALAHIARVRDRNEVFRAVQMHARSEKEAVDTLWSLWEKHKSSQDLWIVAQIAIALLRLEDSGQADSPIVEAWKARLESFRRYDASQAARENDWANVIVCCLRAEMANLDNLQKTTALAETSVHGLQPDKEWCERAWELAQVALMLGRLLKEARSAPGVDFKADDVKQCFETAIEQLQQSRLLRQIQQQALHASLAEAIIAKERERGATSGLALEALEHAEAAVELDPLSAYERSVLGRIYTDFTELQEAESASEDAQLCSPDAPSYLLEEGYAYLKLATECRDYSARSRLLEQAVPFLEQSLTLYTSTQVREKGRAHFTLGHVYRELSNFARAVGHFRVAETLGYVRTTSMYCKAWSLLRNGQYDAAVRAFADVVDTSVSLHPELKSLFPSPAGGTASAARVPHRYRRNGMRQTRRPNPLQAQFAPLLHTLVDRDRETDKERSLGLVLCCALLGKVYCFLERDAVPSDFGVLVRTARQILAVMEAPTTSQRSDDVQMGWQMLLDCHGWRLLKRDGARSIDAAIRYFRRAISIRAHPETYYHLALAYEAKLIGLDGEQNLANKRRLVLAVRTQCAHIASLDLRHEYAGRTSALLDRLDTQPAERQN